MVDPAALAAIIVPFLPVLSVTLLAGAALGIPLVGRFYPAGRFLWAFTFVSTFMAWLCLLGSGFQIPNFMQSPAPEMENVLAIRPAFIIDGSSWPVAVALLTLLLAIFLREYPGTEQNSTILWSSMLALTATGLIGIFAVTPLTLMLAWAAIDLAESAVMLYHIDAAEIRRQFILAIGFRMLSICIVYWASAVFQAAEYDLTLLDYAPELIPYLLTAAILRLGIFPRHDPFFKEHGLRRGLGTLTHMTNAAVALLLICRLAGARYAAGMIPWLLMGAAAITLLGAFYWWKAAGEIAGRLFWILALTGLSMAGMFLSLPLASITWALVLILAGSQLFITGRRDRRTGYLALAGLAFCSGLPFTPAWYGMAIFGWGGSAAWLTWAIRLLFMLALVVLLAGYYRHAHRDVPATLEEQDPAQNWGEAASALLLLGVFTGLGVWMTFRAPPLSWIPGAIAAGGTVLLIFVQSRLRTAPRLSAFRLDEQKTIPIEGKLALPGIETPIEGDLALPGIETPIEKGLALPGTERRLPGRFINPMGSLRAVVSLNWLYLFFYRFFDVFRRLFRMMTRILEGEGGFLWALLLFILLVSFVFRPAGGR